MTYWAQLFKKNIKPANFLCLWDWFVLCSLKEACHYTAARGIMFSGCLKFSWHLEKTFQFVFRLNWLGFTGRKSRSWSEQLNFTFGQMLDWWQQTFVSPLEQYFLSSSAMLLCLKLPVVSILCLLCSSIHICSTTNSLVLIVNPEQVAVPCGKALFQFQRVEQRFPPTDRNAFSHILMLPECKRFKSQLTTWNTSTHSQLCWPRTHTFCTSFCFLPPSLVYWLTTSANVFKKAALNHTTQLFIEDLSSILTKIQYVTRWQWTDSHLSLFEMANGVN